MALLQNELAEDERRALDDHLDRCADCAMLVADLASMMDSEAAATSPQVPSKRLAVAGEEPPLEERDAQMQERIGGRYTVLRMVGRGGMGTVYEAHDESLGRKVAIKVLRADLIEPEQRQEHSSRLLREARLLAAIYHPHVLNVYDVGVWREQVFMAVQFIEGTTLRDWLKRQSPPWRQILDIYLKVGGGLAEAHKLGLVHRDIKPGNVMMEHTGRPWLVDFGLACAIGGEVRLMDSIAMEGLSDDLLASTVTHTGTVMGTPAYMAPEQHLGQDTDERTDQFSFCAALFESLYGRRAFAGHNRQEVKDAVCAGQIRQRPEGPIPADVYNVLARGMARQPDARYPSLPMLLDALRDAADTTPVWKRLGRPVVAIGALAVVGGGLYALGASGLLGQEPTPQPVSPTPVTEAKADAGPEPAAVQPVPKEEPAKPAPLTRAQKEALFRERLVKLRQACLDDAAECTPLIDRVRDCCMSGSIEGVVSEASYKVATDGLTERLMGLCDAPGGNRLACTMAAFTYSFSFHDYQTPEGNLVPKFIDYMSRACRRGEYIACTAIQDTFDDEYYGSEGEFSIKTDRERLVDILGAGCQSGEGRVCWLLAQSLMASKNIRQDHDRATELIEDACDKGWPTACLVGGIVWRAHRDVEACKMELSEYRKHIPDNDILDSTASWNDLDKFCKGVSRRRDDAKALALWSKGCGLDSKHVDRGTTSSLKKAIAQNCKGADTLKTGVDEEKNTKDKKPAQAP